MMEKGSKSGTTAKSQVTRGQATRFGYKPPAPPLPSVPASPAENVIVQETIEPLVIAPVLPKNGTPRLSRARKDQQARSRFGFLPQSNQLSNKVADLQGSQENLRPKAPVKLGGVRSFSETRYNKSVDGKVLTSTNKIPPPTGLARSALHHRSNDSVVCSQAAGKMAKTVANNHTLRTSNPYGGEGAAKQRKGPDVMEIRQLEQSPGAASKFRHHIAQPQKLARPMEMVFSGPKKFELRDVPSSTARGSQEHLRHEPRETVSLGTSPNTTHNVNMTVNERIRREVVGLPPRYPTPTSMTSSIVSTSSILSPCDPEDEEKLRRDTKATEKTRTVPEENCPTEEDLWGGPGEAMALDDELPNTDLADIDHSPESMNPPLRSVLLTIEDPTFATLAALSNAGLLEDETAPDSPDISCSSPSSVEPLPPPPADISSKPGTPHSPGTPTHASNSSSSDTKDRDFLIDDEIADQPGLVFGSGRRRDDESSILDTAKTLAHIASDISQVLHNSLHRDSHGGSAGSISTLSPCESLASDDMMGDYELSALDDLNDPEEAHNKSEIMNQSEQIIKEWSSLLNSHPSLSAGLRKTPRPRLRSATRTAGESPTSHVTSPRRLPRRIEAGSPGDDKSDDSGIKIKKDTWHHMYHDVVNIKGLLTDLKKALAQPEPPTEEEEAANKGPGGTHNHHFPGEDGLHLDDLRRQIVLLEMENEEKDRKIRALEEQLRLANEARPVAPPRSPSRPKPANIATQTDRVRPVTTLFTNSPNNSTASIVSSSETTKAGLRYIGAPRLSAPLNSYKVS